MVKRNAPVYFDRYISLWNTDAHCTVLALWSILKGKDWLENHTDIARFSFLILSRELVCMVCNLIPGVGPVYISRRVYRKRLRGENA
jgi:hypothetical protein